ncbi:MAG: formylmethanofuran dehydrogenase subunit C [archaeon YNP-WB-040]|nr:formylmethanofuran dehydrogenase subunit C [Candidatus Culexarchaeum yellowstonense]
MSVKSTYIVKLKYEPKVPVDARNISPNSFAGKSLNDILKLGILEGGVSVELKDLFDVSGPPNAPGDVNSIEILIEGLGSGKLKYIGYRMSGGRIVVKGDVGHFAGYRMIGGSILIEGKAGSYLGAKMKGGSIEVMKGCGDCVGGKLPGERPGKGMSGGEIVIHGDAGSQIGFGMKGGRIIIDGNAGMLCGLNMMGGTILIQKNCDLYPGARMTAGRVIVGGVVEGILPSFYFDSIVPSVRVGKISMNKPFAVFIADAVVGGRGSVYISLEDNKSLIEQYKDFMEERVEVE